MRTAAICIILAVSALAPTTASAGATIAIYTDDSAYQSGDTIEISLSAQNNDEAMSVAVYVGLLLPDGDIWSTQYNGWSHSIEPWIPETFVPAWFEMDRTPFWTFELPSDAPPIEEEGNYNFAAVLTYPGTFDWASELSLAPFTVCAAVGLHYYVNVEKGDDSSDGSFDFPWRTITHALATVEGFKGNPATIDVAAGTYAASTNSETFPLNMKSWVSLCGENAELSVLDAEGAAHQVIYCDGVHDLTIEGFTITGGYAQDTMVSEDGSGGGICCEMSSPTIQNNLICNNSAYFDGGGISCNGGSPVISKNRIASNSARGGGGGILCWGKSSPAILDNIVEDNWSSSSIAYGGGIASINSSPTVMGNETLRNQARTGGGIYCSGGSATIVDNIVTHNSAIKGGGYTAMAAAWRLLNATTSPTTKRMTEAASSVRQAPRTLWATS